MIDQQLTEGLVTFVSVIAAIGFNTAMVLLIGYVSYRIANVVFKAVWKLVH